MDRVAIFTTECTQVSGAIRDLILDNRGKVALVLTSELGGHDPISFTREGFVQGRRSGLSFVKYLLLMLTCYYWYARYDRVRSAISGAPRRCVTIAELCRELGIAHVHTDDVNSPQAVQALREADLDFILINWFDQIIYETVIGIPRRAVVNVHAAYLPKCRGLFPVFYSTLYNEGVYGISVHEIEDREIDAGPLLAQLRVQVDGARSTLFRDAQVNRAGVKLAGEVLENFDAYHGRRFLPSEPDSYHSYPTRQEIAWARRQGMSMSTVSDFLTLCRTIVR